MSQNRQTELEAQLLQAMLSAHRMAYPDSPFGVMMIGQKTVLGIDRRQHISPARLRHAASICLEAADDLEAGDVGGRFIEETTPLIRENPNREDL